MRTVERGITINSVGSGARGSLANIPGLASDVHAADCGDEGRWVRSPRLAGSGQAAGPARGSRARCAVWRWEESGALGDWVDLVGDEPVCFAVHGSRGVGVWGIDQAEDLAVLLVDPVPQVVNAVGVLGLQVGGMCLGHVIDGDRPADGVRVHEQCHGWVLLRCMRLFWHAQETAAGPGATSGGFPILAG